MSHQDLQASKEAAVKEIFPDAKKIKREHLRYRPRSRLFRHIFSDAEEEGLENYSPTDKTPEPDRRASTRAVKRFLRIEWKGGSAYIKTKAFFSGVFKQKEFNYMQR